MAAGAATIDTAATTLAASLRTLIPLNCFILSPRYRYGLLFIQGAKTLTLSTHITQCGSGFAIQVKLEINKMLHLAPHLYCHSDKILLICGNEYARSGVIEYLGMLVHQRLQCT